MPDSARRAPTVSRDWEANCMIGENAGHLTPKLPDYIAKKIEKRRMRIRHEILAHINTYRL